MIRNTLKSIYINSGNQYPRIFLKSSAFKDSKEEFKWIETPRYKFLHQLSLNSRSYAGLIDSLHYRHITRKPNQKTEIQLVYEKLKSQHPNDPLKLLSQLQNIGQKFIVEGQKDKVPEVFHYCSQIILQNRLESKFSTFLVVAASSNELSGRFQKVYDLCRVALPYEIQKHGEKSLQIGEIYTKLAVSAFRLKKPPKQFIDYAIEAEAIWKAIYGYGHKKTISSIFNSVRLLEQVPELWGEVDPKNKCLQILQICKEIPESEQKEFYQIKARIWLGKLNFVLNGRHPQFTTNDLNFFSLQRQLNGFHEKVSSSSIKEAAQYLLGEVSFELGMRSLILNSHQEAERLLKKSITYQQQNQTSSEKLFVTYFGLYKLENKLQKLEESQKSFKSMLLVLDKAKDNLAMIPTFLKMLERLFKEQQSFDPKWNIFFEKLLSFIQLDSVKKGASKTNLLKLKFAVRSVQIYFLSKSNIFSNEASACLAQMKGIVDSSEMKQGLPIDELNKMKYSLLTADAAFSIANQDISKGIERYEQIIALRYTGHLQIHQSEYLKLLLSLQHCYILNGQLQKGLQGIVSQGKMQLQNRQIQIGDKLDEIGKLVEMFEKYRSDPKVTRYSHFRHSLFIGATLSLFEELISAIEKVSSSEWHDVLISTRLAELMTFRLLLVELEKQNHETLFKSNLSKVKNKLADFQKQLRLIQQASGNQIQDLFCQLPEVVQLLQYVQETEKKFP